MKRSPAPVRGLGIDRSVDTRVVERVFKEWSETLDVSMELRRLHDGHYVMSHEQWS